MTRVRQWLLGLASSSAFYSGVVPALGLGEITLHSALNQPLEAEIELLQVADLSAGDLSIRLASAEVFNRSGVDRLMFLNDLRFIPLLRGGNSVIRVVSSQPVREPYLNFILEVARPNGQLLREYTVLLDPPGSSAYRALASVPNRQATPASQPASSAAPAKPAVKPVAELGQRYRVASGDSLWKIAARLRADGSQAAQQVLMRDIHALNPQAFSAGDSNRLRAGADLLLPDSAFSSDAPLETLANPEAPDAQVERAATAATPPLDAQIESLSQAQQRVDQQLAEQAAENAQLQQGLAQLQAQLQQLQAQLSDRDRQLAELQTELAARPAPQQVPQAFAAVVEQAPAVAPDDQAAAAAEGGWGRTGFVALALLLATATGLVWRRRRQVEPVEPMDRANRLAPEPVASQAESIEPARAPVPAATPASQAVEQLASAPSVRSPAPSDALEGANIYIAYGRLGEAADTLRKALQDQPQRGDIRFRLLEVLAQQGDVQAFAREEALLRDAGFTPARIDQLKAGHPQLLAATAADPLDSAVLELDEPAPEGSSEVLVEDDFQLNLDDLSLDADWDLVSPFAPGPGKKAAAAPSSGRVSPAEPQDALAAAADRDARSPFAESMLVEETSADGWLQDELHDAFGTPAQVDDGVFSGDLEQLAGSRDNLAKLNLALAYIDQGNLGGACNILNQVIDDGDEQQKREARELLARIA